MNSDDQKPPWFDLAEKATNETDPSKLISLVEQLCEAIDKVRPKDDLANRSDSKFDC